MIKKQTMCMGVELEFVDAEFGKVAQKLLKKINHIGYPLYVDDDDTVASLKHKNPSKRDKYWSLVEDGSVQDYDHESCVWTGGEVVSPILPVTPESFRQIQHVIRAMNAAGAVYNVKTGIHVHIDLKGVDRLVLLGIWSLMSDNIYDLFGERARNQYAQELYKITHATKNHDARNALALILLSNGVEDLYAEKYSTLHLYDKEDDLDCPIGEFRVGQMSSDIYLMTAWIKSCCQVVAEASKYRDVLDFLQAEESYTLRQLNCRAPSALRWSRKETDEIRAYV